MKFCVRWSSRVDFNISSMFLHISHLCQQTYYADRFYEVRIHCPDTYPAQPPDVRFVSKIVMSCVDKNGKVIMSKLPAMKNWNRNMGIEQVLQAIRMEMCSDANRRTRQPADGTTY